MGLPGSCFHVSNQGLDRLQFDQFAQVLNKLDCYFHAASAGLRRHEQTFLLKGCDIANWQK